MSRPLDEELDDLYRRPLREFVPARDELARSLKKSGDDEGAKRVKGLDKPGASAWAVNQLYFHDRELFDGLVASGDAYREAQSASLAGMAPERLAEADDRRREALEQARERAFAYLRESSVPAGAAVLRRVATTLEALVSYGSANPRPWNGRASRDLEPPGFGALSGLAAPSPPSSPSASDVVTTGGVPEVERERSEARVREAERALDEARATLGAAENRARDARAAMEEARERLVRAERTSRDTEAEVERARARFQAKETELDVARRS